MSHPNDIPPDALLRLAIAAEFDRCKDPRHFHQNYAHGHGKMDIAMRMLQHKPGENILILHADGTKEWIEDIDNEVVEPRQLPPA